MKNNILKFLKKVIFILKKYSLHILLIILIFIGLFFTPFGHRYKAEQIGLTPIMCKNNEITKEEYLKYQDNLSKFYNKKPSITEALTIAVFQTSHEYADNLYSIRVREYRLFLIIINDKYIIPSVDTSKCRCETILKNGECAQTYFKNPIPVDYSSITTE